MRKVTTLTMLMLAFAAIGTADAQVRDHRRATTERAPAIGRLAYGPDQCLYRFTGRGWSPLGLCHRWVQSNMAYLMMSSRPGVIHSVLHYADGRVVRVVDLISSREIWLNPDGTVKGARPITAASARIGAPPIEAMGTFQRGALGVQTRTNCRTPTGYIAIGNPCWTIEDAMRQEARQRAAETRGAFSVPIAPRPSKMDPRLQEMWTNGNIRANGVLLAPPCNSSLNGCR